VMPTLAPSQYSRRYREFDFFLRCFLAGNLAQEVRNAVEARTAVIVGSHDVPRRFRVVGRLKQRPETRPMHDCPKRKRLVFTLR
jgi:hypothetical protein